MYKHNNLSQHYKSFFFLLIFDQLNINFTSLQFKNHMKFTVKFLQLKIFKHDFVFKIYADFLNRLENSAGES